MRILPLFLALSAAWITHAEDPASPAGLPAAPDAPAGPEGGPPGAEVIKKRLESLQRSDFAVAKIQNNTRQMDPFGLPMDPTNMIESPIADQYGELDEVPTLNNSSLKNALDTLPISGIYPARGKIVLGARQFNVGDVFGMKLEELTIRLRFEGVRGDSIFFKDLDTQEIASVEFNTKPKEFEPITKESKPAPLKGIQAMNELFIVN